MNWRNLWPATVTMSAVGVGASAASRLNSLPWSSTRRMFTLIPVSASNCSRKLSGTKFA